MTATAARPATMPLNPDGLPDDPLMRQHQFVAWAWTWSEDKDKWDKPPLRPHDGYAASVTAPKDWSALPVAIRAVERFHLSGIGVVLTGTEGVTGIDLDKCRDRETGAIEDWAQAIIDRFASYWEPSASGTGIRIFIRAKLPTTGRRKGRIEMYDSGRYLTINGNPGPGASRHFEQRQAELDAWHAEIFPVVAAPVHRGHPPTSTDAQAVLDRCRNAGNGAKFSRLYDTGTWEGDYPSRSEARAGLCSMIGFWANRDPAQIETLFEGSALYDEKKWPRERDRVLALASRGEAFDWTQETHRPLSTVDTPSFPDADDDLGELLALSHDDLARLALLRGRLVAERDRRLDAIDELLTSPTMTEVEKIVAYGVVKAGAVAQEQQPEDAPTRDLIVNQKTIACSIGVSRQTVGKTLERWTDQGYMRKEARGTGQFTKKGAEIRETVLTLPARTLTDNLSLASTWERAKDAKTQGGNGTRCCPKCKNTQYQKTTRDVKVRTTTISCATLGCSHVYEVTTKEIKGTAETFIDNSGDWATDISTMIDLTLHRKKASSVDTPPCPESDCSPPVEDVVNLGTPPLTHDISVPAWGPVACTDCYAEGRGPLGHIWTCGRCKRQRLAGGDVAAGGGG